MARMKDFYKEEVAPALMKKFGYKSVMQIPKLDKIVINVGAGEAKENAKAIDSISGDLAKITGQKPVVCKAKKSVANFKLREGMPIGVKVTLRGDRMYEFLDRLFNVALPRVRDFRGINPNSFDGRQLQHGHPRAADLPRDRLRQGRQGAGHGHLLCHHCQYGRRGSGVPHSDGRSVYEIRRDYCGQDFYETEAAAGSQVLFP